MEGGGSVGSAGAANGNLNANSPPPFLSKTYDMVDDPATDAVVSWGPASNSFIVWNPPEFAKDLLPKYFKHNNFSSFVRQLNTYGFRKVDPDRWEFANEGFLRGQKHLLKNINRRKPVGNGAATPALPPPSPPTGPCVEVGKFGIEEEIERLKRDKNVLMQELIKLRQQQATTDHDLQSLGQQLQGMERRQQQMMSFLAKAMQSPGFLASFVHQPAAATAARRLSGGGSKKRRLPNGDDGGSPDGQIVKYQPLMNEAAKALLLQILQMNSSPMPSPTARPSAAISEIRSPPDPTEAVACGSLAMDGCQSVAVDEGQLVATTTASGGQWASVTVNGGQLAAEVGMVANEGQLATVMASGGQLTAADGEQLVVDLEEIEDGSSKLPGISDAFWEQFLTEGPPLGVGWDPEGVDEGMEQITEQMGLLSSEPDNW